MMRRWPDNLRLLGQSKQRWQARNLEFASNSLRSVSSWKDIRTSSQKPQSRQRRTKSPKTGREEKTREMAREAKTITRPSLPAPVPGKPNLSHLYITCAVVPVPLPHAMLRGEASNRVGRNDRQGNDGVECGVNKRVSKKEVGSSR